MTLGPDGLRLQVPLSGQPFYFIRLLRDVSFSLSSYPRDSYLVTETPQTPPERSSQNFSRILMVSTCSCFSKVPYQSTNGL